ncbi:MAG: helix-turn-helix domain-containing protein [Rhodospirillales bacterium]
MGWDDIGESACPIARSLAVLGDRWTLLIVRELFLGGRRFDAFQAQTGISPHLLSVRLRRLEDAGVVERRRYQDRPARFEYRLTAKGKDLLGVVLALRGWGLRWGGFEPGAEPAVRLFHTACGTEIESAARCPGCGAPLQPRDITLRLGAAYASEREGRRKAAAGTRPPARRRDPGDPGPAADGEEV